MLCRHAKHWHLYVRLPQHLSENIKDTKENFCQGGKGSLTLFAHAMQGAAEMVLNRRTRYACQGEKEIRTVLVHAMQGAAEMVLNRRTRYTCQGGKEILTLLVHAMQGAAEMVLDRCTRYIETDGSIVELSDEKKKELGDMISSMADKGLRTLCLSYRDYQADSDDQLPEESPDEDLTACCVVGIKVCCHCALAFAFERMSQSKLLRSVIYHGTQMLQRQQDMQTSADSATEWAFICTL